MLNYEIATLEEGTNYESKFCLSNNIFGLEREELQSLYDLWQTEELGEFAYLKEEVFEMGEYGGPDMSYMETLEGGTVIYTIEDKSLFGKYFYEEESACFKVDMETIGSFLQNTA